VERLRRAHFVRLHPRADTDYCSQGRTVLAAGLDGFIIDRPDQGLFSNQTRLLNCYRYRINNDDWWPVALSNFEQHSWMGYYIQSPPGYKDSELDRGSGQVEAISQRSVELRLSRFVGDGVHEDVDVTNFTGSDIAFDLRLELDGDFLDQEETHRNHERRERSQDWRKASDGIWEFALDHSATHEYDNQGDRGVASLHRGLRARIKRSDSHPSYANGVISFPIRLRPRESWHACIELLPVIEGQVLPAQYSCYSFGTTDTEFDRLRERFHARSTKFDAGQFNNLSYNVVAGLEQAKHDLAALRLYDMDHGDDAWTVAAGLPIYIALFGRDTLTVSWEAGIVGTDILTGTLQELPKWQGTKIDDWRDEQPGRMMHEAHTNPLSMLNYNPRKRYYGAETTSKFYPVAVAELWHWTGDKELVWPLIGPALRALEWCDTYEHDQGNGFYSYKTRSVQGTRNQGWKDSADAIVYPDGRLVEPPIATVEEQGFAYVAKLHLSEVLWWLDEKDMAHKLYHEAQEFKRKFNDAFWMPDLGYYCLGLDADGKQIQSIGSDAGHLFAAGIVDDALAKQTADRFMADDLFTGWGMRTLSSEHPAFNPYSYHRGSVWPVENGSFCMGLLRFGMYEHLHKLSKAAIEASALFEYHRLPEVFSGHQRDAKHPFPALYPKTCWPQAWSSSSLFAVVQSLLGIYPYAPLHVLIVNPVLPEWLPEITLRDLHVGQAVVSIKFFRNEDGSSDYRVLDLQGKLHVLRVESPWSIRHNWTGNIVNFIKSFTPGR
jgi:glycogen debranching enzyme